MKVKQVLLYTYVYVYIRSETFNVYVVMCSLVMSLCSHYLPVNILSNSGLQ